MLWNLSFCVHGMRLSPAVAEADQIGNRKHTELRKDNRRS